MKKLIAFDMDGTLAESKQPIAPDMAALLARLLDVAEVCVISGGDWPQFEAQLVGRLPAEADLARLIVMPATGTKMYRFRDRAWREVYAELFPDDERKRIVAALEQAAAGLDDAKIWGERIEDRGSQITFSGLGQQAPLAAKEAWDPDLAKRKRMQAALQESLPGLSVRIGGSTSIDITRPGTDKAHGMRRLAQETGHAFEDILFLGDAVYPGGNDRPVPDAGIDTVGVRDPAETMSVVKGVIACLRTDRP